MSVETMYTLRRAEPAFRDLDRVVLRTAAVTDDGDTMPAGAEGTIVYVAPDMHALIVEFAAPEGALVTIPASAVSPADPRVG
ncbi:DUF4926 domain-containing protein [Methylobacterium sp. E-066]|uniref:DUF4926 domain-containing protein n=1 Tax=Methylobacterium sp. E-066 TaxID=2836584 RepID=UPI001FB97A23|nr:DUF4926 domain-containing protein [Methylobacterium sp. E-066]MCJ2143909.1 DUF4926 domain-containing protein [Methylobacterium sp. E-066]